jgi:hypothetical protein
MDGGVVLRAVRQIVRRRRRGWADRRIGLRLLDRLDGFAGLVHAFGCYRE